MRRALGAAFIAALSGSGLVGCSDGTTRPSVEPDAVVTVEAAQVQPQGFSMVQARITAADAEVCEVCLWLADEVDERSRGLMGVTDLGDAVGMAFRFEAPTSRPFYMFQTPTPLSIAWFAPDGRHVDSADMTPCLDTPAGDCKMYSLGRRYDVAVEVFAGDLAELGIGPGSSIELIDASDADASDASDCPATP